MRSYIDTIKLLFGSLLGSDCIIFGVAILALIFYVVTIVLRRVLKDDCDNLKNDNAKIIITSVKRISTFYNLFMTLISIFPLLGMLGTVFGLLGLDLANGDMENIKNNFFIALTSTAWGIIFSVIFKILHALIVEDVENQIEIAKKILKEKKQQ